MTRHFAAQKRIKIPQALSKLEETLALHIFTADLPEMPEREYKFALPERKWAFDFAWPSHKFACEVHGKLWGGRHTHPEGFQKDREKMNAAVAMGWRVLEFTERDIQSMQAIKAIREALGA